MFENFKKITIKGGFFDEETPLTLFHKAAVSVIYGRNGSGKSTIARCIKELVLPDGEKNPEYTVCSDAAIPDVNKQDVFVFDEDFVTEQVRFKEDGIQTIVMLGEKGDIDKQIEAKEDDKAKMKAALEGLYAQRERYNNSGDNISPLFYYNKLWNALREDDSWAEIDRQVKGNKVKSKLSEDIVLSLASQDEPKESYDELRAALMADLDLYLKSSNAQAVMWTREETIPPDDLQELKKLLETVLEAPHFTDREQRLISLLAAHPQHSTLETRQMIAEGWDFCPLCLREITVGDAESIKQTLSLILNDEADKYMNRLSEMSDSYQQITQVMPDFPEDLHKEEVNAASVAQQKLNASLSRIRNLIEERKRRIYEVLPEGITDDDINEYASLRATWMAAIVLLGKRVEEFNATVNARKELFAKIRKENNLLARKQHSATMAAYKKAIDEKEKNQSEIKSKEGELRKIDATINELRAKKENTKIALDYINDELSYVFYSNRRLKLVPGGDDTYKLKVNGRHVKPNKISVGERNVLALCYFFARMFRDMTVDDKYKHEYLVVIDDPVSSFDHGNRLGVMTLLRYQFSHLLKGNDKTRILVMSHDLHSVFDLLKIRNELCANAVKNNWKSFMELENKQLERKIKDSEYWKLLKHVYDYAVDGGADDPDETSDMSIGNIMRRLLEAFSSFCYSRGFEEMLRMEDLLKSIPEEKQSYYGNFMCRLALNGESHEEEAVYSLDTINAYFTRNEKVQTAKSVLLFLLYVNRPHLRSYLADEIPTIESWRAEEASWMGDGA